MKCSYNDTAGKQQIEDKIPIYIADLQSMTLARRLRKKRPGSHDDNAGGVASTVVGEVTRPAEPEASSSREIGPSDASEHTAEKAEDAVNAGRRVRKQRVLTYVSSLGYTWWTVVIFLQCYKRLIVSSCLTVCSTGNLRAIRNHCAEKRLPSGRQLASWRGVSYQARGDESGAHSLWG